MKNGKEKESTQNPIDSKRIINARFYGNRNG